ncbi:MAG: hypothetical protein ACLFSE_09740 [Spirochaetia bacterium]
MRRHDKLVLLGEPAEHFTPENRLPCESDVVVHLVEKQRRPFVAAEFVGEEAGLDVVDELVYQADPFLAGRAQMGVGLEIVGSDEGLLGVPVTVLIEDRLVVAFDGCLVRECLRLATIRPPAVSAPA